MWGMVHLLPLSPAVQDFLTRRPLMEPAHVLLLGSVGPDRPAA
jgi:hypothetical protein